MEFSEKEIEDLIFNDLTSTNGSLLYDRGLILDDDLQSYKWYRQFNLGSYGIADIVGYKKKYNKFKDKIYPYISIILLELKAVPLRTDDVDQVLRYKTAIQNEIRKKYKFTVAVSPFLLGPSISSGHYTFEECMLPVLTFDYNIGGFWFRTQNGSWYKKNDNYSLIKQLKNG